MSDDDARPGQGGTTPGAAPTETAVPVLDHPTHVAPPPGPTQRSRGAAVASGLMGVRVIVTTVVVLIAGIGALIGVFHHGSGGSSTDGTFSTGDCVRVTSSSVANADCGGSHDGRITAVLHDSYSSCPSGSQEFDVNDNTGNLCVDTGDSSH